MKNLLKKLTENFKMLTVFIVTFIFLFSASIFNLPFLGRIEQIIRQTISSYSPTEDLFEDSSDMFFVSTPFGINVLGYSMPSLNIPSKGASYTKEQEQYVFSNLLSVVVKASGDGVVTKVGYDEGIKYIEILHSSNITTKYKNVDMLGVCIGDRVEKGDLIATITGEKNLYFSISQNEQVYSNYSIEGESIIWQ